jgi:hypothetical protein
VGVETVFVSAVFIHFELDVFSGHFDFLILPKGLVHLGCLNHVL